MRMLATAVLATLLLPASASAATIFGVTNTNQLVSFNSVNPGTFLSNTQITGTSATFLAIDFRGSNGLLYGLGDDYGLYTINTTTGFASQIGGSLPLAGSNFGFDFNEVVDAIRVVGNLDDNYVVNANTGTATQFTDVAFGAGDLNSGVDPIVSGNAYIHGTPSQFAIETATDSLVMQANNEGTLTTVGSLGVAVGPRTSFDIGFDGVAYMANDGRFWTVNLGTGAATFVGNNPETLFAISSAVPEPATWGMMLMGFGAIGSVVRRRRKTQVTPAFA